MSKYKGRELLVQPVWHTNKQTYKLSRQSISVRGIIQVTS